MNKNRVLEGENTYEVAPGLQNRTIRDCLTCAYLSCDGCPKQRREKKGRKLTFLHKCRNCGANGEIKIDVTGRFYIKCPECGYWNGRTYALKKSAAKAWNREVP